MAQAPVAHSDSSLYPRTSWHDADCLFLYQAHQVVEPNEAGVTRACSRIRFSLRWPIPKSRETGIVMLADSVKQRCVRLKMSARKKPWQW